MAGGWFTLTCIRVSTFRYVEFKLSAHNLFKPRHSICKPIVMCPQRIQKNTMRDCIYGSRYTRKGILLQSTDQGISKLCKLSTETCFKPDLRCFDGSFGWGECWQRVTCRIIYSVSALFIYLLTELLTIGDGPLLEINSNGDFMAGVQNRVP